MDQHGSGHGGGHGPAVPRSLPRATWWPLLTAAAALVVGLTLFWAADEDSEDATVPVVAGAVAFLVVAAVGWAYEEGAFARWTRSQHIGRSAAVRQTQVITFAIPEGRLDAARESGGILAALADSEGGLRAHAGFEDLRVTVAPAASGTSQAIVETTWGSREAFAGYDGARGTLLDLINNAGDQVVPGSVQAFDMDVVRDTKESPVRFTLLHAVTALGALVLGGLGVGIVAGIVQEDPVAVVDGNGGNGGADPYAVEAGDNFFDRDRLVAPPDTEVTYVLTNGGTILHNIAFYEAKDGNPIAVGEFAQGGTVSELTFTTPGPGEYYFQCDLHPAEMFGVFEVREGAPGPGGGGGGGGGGGPLTVIATDNAFDTGTIEVTAGEEVSITLKNEGAILHNLAILTAEGGEPVAEGSRTAFLQAGGEETLTFTAPAAGTYFFVCELHPAEMRGEFIAR